MGFVEVLLAADLSILGRTLPHYYYQSSNCYHTIAIDYYIVVVVSPGMDFHHLLLRNCCFLQQQHHRYHHRMDCLKLTSKFQIVLDSLLLDFHIASFSQIVDYFGRTLSRTNSHFVLLQSFTATRIQHRSLTGMDCYLLHLILAWQTHTATDFTSISS
jgi:hypothetical protein